MEDKKRKKEDKKKKDSAQKVGFDVWILLSSWNINSIGGNKMLIFLYLNLKTDWWRVVLFKNTLKTPLLEWCFIKESFLHHFPGTEVFNLDISSP